MPFFPFGYNDPTSLSETFGLTQVMMREFIRIPANPARTLLILLWGTLCGLIFAAPMLAACSKHSIFAGVLYLFFAPVCHQNHDRSFLIAGHTLAVCHRCTGIYLGLFLGSLIPSDRRLFASVSRRRAIVLVSTLPLLLDVISADLGIWINSPLSRFTTGLIFGAMLSTLLVPGVAEILDGALRRPSRIGTSHIKGEIP